MRPAFGGWQGGGTLTLRDQPTGTATLPNHRAISPLPEIASNADVGVFQHGEAVGAQSGVAP